MVIRLEYFYVNFPRSTLVEFESADGDHGVRKSVYGGYIHRKSVVKVRYALVYLVLTTRIPTAAQASSHQN